MPELPELEVVKDVLGRRLVGRTLVGVVISAKGGPLVLRDLTGRGFAEQVAQARILEVRRRGKYVLFDLLPAARHEAPLLVAVNPKLSGRLQLCRPGAKKAGPVHVTLLFSQPDEELRYVDSKTMGQIYLTADSGLIPTFNNMGPDALEIGLPEFTARLHPFRGEIKGLLTRGSFVAGIGNAYADEILWQAGLHPYRKRTDLGPSEIEQLYTAMRSVLLEAIDKVRAEMGDDIHLKPRDFFRVHMREGQACPRCGTAISGITAQQRITNFCRRCQPGGLIRGM
jgi:formamidopyrimidine-DNA glycosylase